MTASGSVSAGPTPSVWGELILRLNHLSSSSVGPGLGVSSLVTLWPPCKSARVKREKSASASRNMLIKRTVVPSCSDQGPEAIMRTENAHSDLRQTPAELAVAGSRATGHTGRCIMTWGKPQRRLNRSQTFTDVRAGAPRALAFPARDGGHLRDCFVRYGIFLYRRICLRPGAENRRQAFRPLDRSRTRDGMSIEQTTSGSALGIPATISARRANTRNASIGITPTKPTSEDQRRRPETIRRSEGEILARSENIPACSRGVENER